MEDYHNVIVTYIPLGNTNRCAIESKPLIKSRLLLNLLSHEEVLHISYILFV